MKRSYIPFFTFLVLLLLTIPFPFDFAVSVVSGWHTSVFPPSLIWAFVVIIALLFVTIGYWLLSKRMGKINWTFFTFHVILTIPIVIFIRFPLIFLHPEQSNEEEMKKAISLQLKLTPVVRALFILGQSLFIIYLARRINSKQIGT